jgi:hypothetical protein
MCGDAGNAISGKNATHPMVLPHPGHRNFQRVNKRLIGSI